MSPVEVPTPALEPDTEAFWRACRAGRLELVRCRACRWYVHPPRPSCPRCHARELGWEPVSGRGRVASFTVNHQAWMPGMVVPYVIGLVELAEQGDLRLTTNVVGCAADAVHVDMPVRVTFRTVNVDVALPLFEPDPDAAAAPPPPSSQRRPLPAARRPNAEQRLERRAIVSGVGQSRIGRRLMRTGMDLTCEAALRAIADAGLQPDDVDGLATYPGPLAGGGAGFAGPGEAEVQDALGLRLGWHCSTGEGAAQLGPVMLAVLAVAAGLCRHALVYRTVTEATAAAGRAGIAAGARTVGGLQQWVVPFGAMSPANWIAMHATRHMHAFGTTREHLAEVALAARGHAALNPDAVYREPLTLEQYLAARMVSSPFGLYDCDTPCDGSTAVVISTADAARDLPKPAVRIDAMGGALRSRPSWDQWEDLTTMAARDAAAQLWARAEVAPADVDTVQLYDGFSWLALAWIEALGFCKAGEGGPFMGGGRVRLGGELPLNTGGGQLSGGRLHGFGFLAEGIRQVRRECGARQVQGCEVALVAAGGGPLAGCLLLTR
ncbi:MAG: OB-fold domain-containing protein [Candidatus Binatia bacterium]